MNPRTGRYSGDYDEAEQEVISPQAARIYGGGRSGPWRQGPGPALRGAEPRSRVSMHAGGTRRDNGLKDMYEREVAEARRDSQVHYGGRHHNDEGTRAPFGGYASARERQHDYAEEDDLEDMVDPPRHNQHRFGGHGARPIFHDDTVAQRQPGLAEDRSFLATSARPGRSLHASRLHGMDSRGRDSFQDNERYGVSRGEGGNRARSEVAYDELDASPSTKLVGSHGTRVDRDTQEQDGRFVPYTFRMLHRKHVDFLAKIFNVRASKVKEWCEKDYIRMDRMRDCETNIDPLLSTLTSRDRENYADALRRIENKKDIGELVGWGPRHVPADYERGYDYGRISVHSGRNIGGRR